MPTACEHPEGDEWLSVSDRLLCLDLLGHSSKYFCPGLVIHPVTSGTPPGE
jgi:hypothetical protein